MTLFLQDHIQSRPIRLLPITDVRCRNCKNFYEVRGVEAIETEDGSVAQDDIQDSLTFAMDAQDWEQMFCPACVNTSSDILRYEHDTNQL